MMSNSLKELSLYKRTTLDRLVALSRKDICAYNSSEQTLYKQHKEFVDFMKENNIRDKTGLARNTNATKYKEFELLISSKDWRVRYYAASNSQLYKVKNAYKLLNDKNKDVLYSIKNNKEFWLHNKTQNF